MDWSVTQIDCVGTKFASLITEAAYLIWSLGTTFDPRQSEVLNTGTYRCDAGVRALERAGQLAWSMHRNFKPEMTVADFVHTAHIFFADVSISLRDKRCCTHLCVPISHKLSERVHVYAAGGHAIPLDMREEVRLMILRSLNELLYGRELNETEGDLLISNSNVRIDTLEAVAEGLQWDFSLTVIVERCRVGSPDFIEKYPYASRDAFAAEMHRLGRA